MNQVLETFLEGQENEEETVVVTEQGMFGDLAGDFEIDDPSARNIKK